jgi:hypothetical protein
MTRSMGTCWRSSTATALKLAILARPEARDEAGVGALAEAIRDIVARHVIGTPATPTDHTTPRLKGSNHE